MEEMELSLEERVKSNELVDEATRMKGYLLFTFEKNAHKIDISKKEYEDIRIFVGHGDKIYQFGLMDIYNNDGEFFDLVKEFPTWEEGVTIISYENVFTYEKFVGENLEEKEMQEHKEVENYVTVEKLSSVYWRAMA